MSATCFSMLTACRLFIIITTLGFNEFYVTSGCSFPDFTQTVVNDVRGRTSREWQWKIREQYTDVTAKVNVTGYTFQVSVAGGATSYNRVCLESVGADKFVVTHQVATEALVTYTCMQFIARSASVVQIKELPARNSTFSPGLCDDVELQKSPFDWLMIDRRKIFASSDITTCPLKGGFILRIYDRSQGRSVCDAYRGNTRLESECLEGEGMIFQFRQQKCVPDGLYMYSEQRVLCVAAWQERSLNFTVLRHDVLNYMWVLRTPTTIRADGSQLYLFKDIVVYTHRAVAEPFNYLRLDTVPDTPISVTSLCVDDWEVCEVYSSPCSNGAQLALDCKKKCGVCDVNRPRVCSFPSGYRSKWHDPARSRHPHVLTVDDSILSLNEPHSADASHHYCIDWTSSNQDRRGVPLADEPANEILMVRDFPDGCLPRYRCSKTIQNGHSVLFLKLSQWKSWPFIKSVEEPINCDGFSYDDQSDKPRPHSSLASKRFNLLMSSKPRPVDCNLPNATEFASLDGLFQDGTSCTASLLMHKKSKSKLIFKLSDCSSILLPTNSFPEDLTCVESMTIKSSGNTLLVTRTSTSNKKTRASKAEPFIVHCWLIIEGGGTLSRVIHLLDPINCNEVAMNAKSSREFEAVANFTVSPPRYLSSTMSLPVPKTFSSMLRTTTSSGRSGRDRSSGEKITTTTVKLLIVVDSNENNGIIASDDVEQNWTLSNSDDDEDSMGDNVGSNEHSHTSIYVAVSCAVLLASIIFGACFCGQH